MSEDVPIYLSDTDDSSHSSASSDSERERPQKNAPELSDEQRHALEAAKEGRNIFITGSAGVGKSFLLKEILKIVPKETSYVTASTGVAACNIGGTTLHSFAGIGLGEKSAILLASKIVRDKYSDARKRWRGSRVLVIDEISMIDGNLFQKVENVARLVRGNDKPFGGIQIILCGDFLQLPPVKSQYFAFETKAWTQVVDETIVLKKVFRQKEVGFVTLLNRLRTGQFTELDIEVLNTCRNTNFVDDGIKATRLFPHRHSCLELNNKELKKLKGVSVVYEAIDKASRPMYAEMLDKNSKFASRLELKIGAQVMLLINKNVKGHLVNGARGVVIGFRDKSVSLESNLGIIQSKIDENDNLGSLKGKNLLENTIIISEDEDEERFEDNEHVDSFNRPPIVLFATGAIDVVNVENLSIAAAGKTVASRTQIPLSLAWAVSVHKSQGMTLDRIDVSLAESFEHGQSYVALSRVTSLDGLLLRNFKSKKITAHPKVLDYYKKIDPTFDKFTQEGDEQLKAFVEGKKKLEGYEEVLKQIKERNEAVPSCSHTKDIKSNSHSNLVKRTFDATDCFASDFPPFIPKTAQTAMAKLPDGTDKTDSTGFNEDRTGRSCTSPNNANSLSKNYDITGCVKVGTNTKPLPSTSNALLKAESVLAECKKALEGAQAGPSKFFANEDNPCPGNSKKPCNNTSIAVDSDSDDNVTSDGKHPTRNEVDLAELDAAVFENDDFDESLLKDTSSCTSNGFLDNICPDLLESANSLTRDTVLHHISKRKRSEKDSESKSSKRNSPLVDRDHIKELLKTKAAEIEKKKMAALERRRSAMQRLNK